MTNWPDRLHGRWFVATQSHQLQKKLSAIKVLGVPLVLARDDQGNPFALVDRCPHRQVPLSAGRMTKHGVQCPYHGWVFGSDGRCRKIPGLLPGEAPPAVSAQTAQCLDMGGWVWVRLSGADSVVPPASMTTPLENAVVLTWEDRWNAPAIDAIENFLDPLHTHTIHPGLVRRDTQRSMVTATIRMSSEGFIVDYVGQEKQSGLLYRLFESERSKERVVFGGAGSARIEYGYKNGSEVHITLHFTPETTDQTRVFGRLEVSGRRVPEWLLRLLVRPMLLKIARQDQAIVEMQHANKLKFPPALGVSTRLDIVRPYLDHIWAGHPYGIDKIERDVVIFI